MKNFSTFLRLRSFALMLTVLAVGGCATFSQDGGFNTVEQTTRERTGKDVKWVRNDADQNTVDARIAELLKQPLSIDDAVQIALLNNKGLQASYAELGIAEADLVQAGRLRNPSFSFGRLTRGDEIEYERKLMLPILGLLTMPITTKIESRRFEQAQLRAAHDVLRVADETRRTYFSTVAAQETAKYMEQVKTASEAGADLAKRMAAVGNWSKLRQAQEQSFYADATAQLARARQMVVSERERLTRLLGLWGSSTEFKLPDRLPDLPKALQDMGDAEVQAMQNRLDLMMAKKELAGLVDFLGLTKTTRFINVLEIGYQRNTSNEQPRQTGYEIEFQIPLFDWGSARVARAEAVYMQSVNRAAELAVNARSEVREAYSSYRTAYDLAKHYRDEVVPLKKRISDEQLLRYNGMLTSVFELLADARAQAMSVNASIEALRDYWMADSALQMTMTGGSVAGVKTSAPKTNATAEPAGH